MSPVRYELGFISHKTAFFIVTDVKTSNLTQSLISGHQISGPKFQIGAHETNPIAQFSKVQISDWRLETSVTLIHGSRVIPSCKHKFLSTYLQNKFRGP
jgi:hypothetical protein